MLPRLIAAAHDPAVEEIVDALIHRFASAPNHVIHHNALFRIGDVCETNPVPLVGEKLLPSAFLLARGKVPNIRLLIANIPVKLNPLLTQEQRRGQLTLGLAFRAGDPDLDVRLAANTKIPVTDYSASIRNCS
jgi:hypothetical protein